MTGEDRLQAAEHVLAHELNRLLVAEREHLRDRTAVELLVTHALVAVLPDGLVDVVLAVHRGTEAELQVLGRLAADAQRHAEVVGQVLAAHGNRARTEDMFLIVENPVGRAGAHVDDQHPLLIRVARGRAGRGM